MKAFIIGLIFLIILGILLGGCLLLFPFFLFLGSFLYFLLVFAIVVLLIWLLGKFVIFVFRGLKGTDKQRPL